MFCNSIILVFRMMEEGGAGECGGERDRDRLPLFWKLERFEVIEHCEDGGEWN